MSKTVEQLEAENKMLTAENKMLKQAVKDAVNSLDALYIAAGTGTLIQSDLDDAHQCSMYIKTLTSNENKTT